jgi:hypothetical protein
VTDSGGSELDLLRVIPGPPEVRDGHRLLLTLRFADAVLFRIEHAWTDDLPEWRLSDDLGTPYRELTYSGDDDGSAITFTPGVPDAASRLELAVDDLAFLVPLAIQEREPLAGSLHAAAPGDAAEHEVDLRTMARRGKARRVFVPDRVESHNRLAIVAVIACTDATELVFHHVGVAEEPRFTATSSSTGAGAISLTPCSAGPGQPVSGSGWSSTARSRLRSPLRRCRAARPCPC